MAADEKPSRLPWQPLTFKGVASFAQAPASRLTFIQALVACSAVGSVLCFFFLAWEPVIREAVLQLPERGAIRRGQLDWNGSDPQWLAGNSFLSIAVELNPIGSLGSSADLQLELGRREIRLRSLLGVVAVPYPTGWIISANRQELEPWWGAWRLLVFSGLGGFVFASLFVIWWLLATIYSSPVRFIAFYADREITFGGSWRLACAALMPGALLMSVSILAYALQRFNLVQLIFATLLHVVIGWFFVLIAPFRLPRIHSGNRKTQSRNPFSKRSSAKSRK